MDGLAAGSFCQTLRELGIPPEWVENIELTLTRFARQALAQFEPERLGMPERLRVFCQKKMLDEKMNGGWGFFLLERTDGSPESPSASSQSCVDLYIYREGE